jgi:excisionase family DNA binding protein
MSTVCLAAPRLLTRDEAAEFLGVSPQTLANWAHTGRGGLPYVRVSARAVRYRQSDLETWARNRTVTHTGQAAGL